MDHETSMMDKLERSLKKINQRVRKSEFFTTNSPRKNLFSRKESNDSIIESISLSSNENVDIETTEKEHISDNFIGISNLPLQVQRKLLKKVFHFNLMVVGKSGLGKSTLVNSLFLSDIYSEACPGPSKRIAATLAIENTTVLLTENSVSMHLTVTDTPGFGDFIDNTDCWVPIVEYIDKQQREYLQAEMCVTQRQILDKRVHTCLYFIEPTGHRLKAIDVQFLKCLHTKVNLIPIIAKADTLTKEELINFKQNIREDLKQNEIKIFNFFEDNVDDGLRKKYSSRVPFAVVGSNYIYEQDGQRKRGRQYPWGFVDISNTDHSDFAVLRDLLISHCMYDLIDATHTVHYENYRVHHLTRDNRTKETMID